MREREREYLRSDSALNALKKYFTVERDLIHSKNIMTWIWVNIQIWVRNEGFLLETNPYEMNVRDFFSIAAAPLFPLSSPPLRLPLPLLVNRRNLSSLFFGDYCHPLTIPPPPPLFPLLLYMSSFYCQYLTPHPLASRPPLSSFHIIIVDI